MRPRFLLFLLVSFAILTGTAWAEDSVKVAAASPSVDTFPAGLGYAAVAFATTVFGSCGAIIKHLYDKHEAAKITHAAALEAKDVAHRAEMKDRREEAEKLLREQQAIMKEALTASNANTLALDKVGDALQEHSKISGQILALLSRGGDHQS